MILVLSFLLVGSTSVFAEVPAPSSSQVYELAKTIEVDGRQGVAADADYYYVSASKALYKYSKDGQVLLKNETPFEGLKLESNHLGDIEVYNGEIFAGVENFIDGKGENIQIVIYDAATLKYKRSFNWNPDSGQVEVCGLAVDPGRKIVWMADWVNGSFLYKYDLESGKYLGKLGLTPAPQKQQGIFYHQDKIYITADDGDADKNEPDRLYQVDVSQNVASVPVTLVKNFNEFKRAGEVEGLAIDPATQELVVLMNRGQRIVLGMPKEFYPGYTKEIHELYTYKIK